MANEIRFNSDNFSTLGIQFDAATWTLDEINSINNTVFSDDIDNLIDLCQRLGCAATDTVLTTYESKADKKVYFSIPRIHLNAEGVLSLFIGSNLSFPLTYEKKAYTVGELSFKVVPYRRKDEKEIRAINFVTTVTKTVDDIEEDFEISLGVKCKFESDLNEITKALQSGAKLPDGNLIQIGVGGSGYAIALKPWMLPKGNYKITSVKEPFKLPDGGKIWEGYVSPVDSQGSVDESVSTLVIMNANPFIRNKSETLLKAAMNGTSVYVQINGAYHTSMGIGAIAYASMLSEAKDDKEATQRWKSFAFAANRECLSMRTRYSSEVLKAEEIETLTQKYLDERAKKSSEPKEPKKELATVGTSVPAIDDIPF